MKVIENKDIYTAFLEVDSINIESFGGFLC